jgi:hypothetical protein
MSRTGELSALEPGLVEVELDVLSGPVVEDVPVVEVFSPLKRDWPPTPCR